MESNAFNHWIFSSQIYKMFHKAKDCSENSPMRNFCSLTKKFAVFCEQQRVAVPMTTTHSLNCDGKEKKDKGGSKRMAYEVFLGGSCNPTTWRSDIAIPTLQKLGITYYNPQVSDWGPELIAQEYEAKRTAKVLLFVIDNETRNTAGIIEAAQLAATRNDSLVLVVYPYLQNQMILGETISAQEYYDLMNGLLVLEYFMEKQKIPIFENVTGALNGTSKILREALNVQDLKQEVGMRPTRNSIAQKGMDIITLRELFRSIDVHDTGRIRLGDAWKVLQSNIKCNISISELLSAVKKSDTSDSLIRNSVSTEDLVEQVISLDEFVLLANEWIQRARINGCTSGESEIPSLWSILFKKASKFLRKAFVQPFNQLLDWTHSIGPEFEKRDLYIGVASSDSTWLETSAIPLIRSKGLTFYHPSFNEYTVKTLPQELQRMRCSRLILLIMPQYSRGVALAALIAYLVGLRSNLVLCIQSIPDNCIISGEKMSEQAIKDYNRGRMYLSDYATREGVPVFQNITEALQHAIQLFQRSC